MNKPIHKFHDSFFIYFGKICYVFIIWSILAKTFIEVIWKPQYICPTLHTNMLYASKPKKVRIKLLYWLKEILDKIASGAAEISLS